MEKKSLRRQILARRDELTGAARTAKAKLICETFLASDFCRRKQHIMLYAAFGSEVDLLPLFEPLTKLGKKIYFPLSEKVTHEIRPIAVTSLDELIKGNYGILEPPAKNFDAAIYESLDLILTPGVAFDRTKQRLGYGAGYYDRLFPRLPPTTLKIGIAFSAQIVTCRPAEAHDIPLDYILTEHGFF